jgi:hypothetical protein
MKDEHMIPEPLTPRNAGYLSLQREINDRPTPKLYDDLWYLVMAPPALLPLTRHRIWLTVEALLACLDSKEVRAW